MPRTLRVVAVFEKRNKRGYEDGLGSRIIGTFANCAGGTTPWGTVLSAEENFQAQVPEPVFADGSSMNPGLNGFAINPGAIYGQGNVFGLAGNKYGWMVEVDPANPNDYGTKHTWLGRFRHEAVGVRAVAGKQLAVYSRCDPAGGTPLQIPQPKISQQPARQGQQQANDGGHALRCQVLSRWYGSLDSPQTQYSRISSIAQSSIGY